MAAAHIVRQARVVRHGGMTFALQPFGKRLDLAARRAVDDAGFVLVPREDVEQLLVQVPAAQHAIHEVRAIERPDEHQRRLQPQLRDDIAPHAFGGGRREGVERHAGKILAQPSELAILRAEIMAPLADAVRFVDRDERQVRLLQHPPQRQAPLADDPLGRHVQQPAPPLAHAREHLVALVRQQRAVQERRRDPVDAQAVDLILHQRDERRHDEAEPVGRDRRRLEAQRLAATGREHDDAVARLQNRVHRLALERTEFRKAPDAVERVREQAISVGRTCARCSHRPDAGTPPRARRTCRAGW